jgi:hypothetical protein
MTAGKAASHEEIDSTTRTATYLVAAVAATKPLRRRPGKRAVVEIGIAAETIAARDDVQGAEHGAELGTDDDETSWVRRV